MSLVEGDPDGAREVHLRDCERTDELKAFRKLAETMLKLDDGALSAAMANGTITEVICDG
jgi:hypothetical protein